MTQGKESTAMVKETYFRWGGGGRSLAAGGWERSRPWGTGGAGVRSEPKSPRRRQGRQRAWLGEAAGVPPWPPQIWPQEPRRCSQCAVTASPRPSPSSDTLTAGAPRDKRRPSTPQMRKQSWRVSQGQRDTEEWIQKSFINPPEQLKCKEIQSLLKLFIKAELQLETESPHAWLHAVSAADMDSSSGQRAPHALCPS